MKSQRLQAFEHEKNNLSRHLEDKWAQGDLKFFHFFSANMSYFAKKKYSESMYKDLYKELLGYRILQGIDVNLYNGLNEVKGFKKIDIKEPAIFVSFHVGAYRSFLALLIKNNIDIVLLMDANTYQKRLEIEEQYKNIKELFNSTSDLIIFPADKPDLALQLMITTKKGYSVLAFVDGNNGLGGVFNQKNSLKVNFMGKNIRVRQGLARLSHILSLKIFPIVSHYENLMQQWSFYSPISPDKKGNIDEYSAHTMQKLYDILEQYVDKYPMQWDGWLYMHKFMTDQIEAKKAKGVYSVKINYKLNRNIGLFSSNGKHYLLNKQNYKVFELPENIYTILKENLKKRSLSKKHISVSDMKALYEKNILIPA